MGLFWKKSDAGRDTGLSFALLSFYQRSLSSLRLERPMRNPRRIQRNHESLFRSSSSSSLLREHKTHTTIVAKINQIIPLSQLPSDVCAQQRDIYKNHKCRCILEIHLPPDICGYQAVWAQPKNHLLCRQ